MPDDPILNHVLHLKQEMGEARATLHQHDSRLESIESGLEAQHGMLETIMQAPIYQLDSAISKKVAKYGGIWGVLLAILVIFV